MTDGGKKTNAPSAADKEAVYMDEPNTEDRYRIVCDYMAHIGNGRRVGNLIQHLANMARELVVADRCSIWLADYETETLWTMAAHGVTEIRIPLATGLVGYAIQHGQAVCIEDAQKDPRFNKEVDRQTGYQTQSILVLPLYDAKGQVLGALQLLNKRTRAQVFTEADIRHLQMVVPITSASIENTLLNEEIDETQREIIFMMGAVGEARSQETGSHVRRVAEYSRVLALGVGLSEEEADLLKKRIPDARHRQGGNPGPYPKKARQAYSGGTRNHPVACRNWLSHPEQVQPSIAQDGRHRGARASRALGGRRISQQPVRRGHPSLRTHHCRRGCVRCALQPPMLQRRMGAGPGLGTVPEGTRPPVLSDGHRRTVRLQGGNPANSQPISGLEGVPSSGQEAPTSPPSASHSVTSQLSNVVTLQVCGNEI